MDCVQGVRRLLRCVWLSFLGLKLLNIAVGYPEERTLTTTTYVAIRADVPFGCHRLEAGRVVLVRKLSNIIFKGARRAPLHINLYIHTCFKSSTYRALLYQHDDVRPT